MTPEHSLHLFHASDILVLTVCSWLPSSQTVTPRYFNFSTWFNAVLFRGDCSSCSDFATDHHFSYTSIHFPAFLLHTGLPLYPLLLQLNLGASHDYLIISKQKLHERFLTEFFTDGAEYSCEEEWAQD